MPGTHKHGKFQRFAHLLQVLCVGLTCCWVVGQVFRDAWWVTGLMFYIPSPFLFLLLISAALVSVAHRRLGRAILFVVLALAPLYLVISIENQFGRQTGPDERTLLRVVHWNVCRGYLGTANVVDTLRALDADLYVLSEAPQPFPELPGYESRRMDTMLVLSRFPLNFPVSLNPDQGRLYSLFWKTPQAELNLLVADLPSSIQYHRHPMLTELMQQLATTRASLLIGDLNAPRRSLALDDLPAGYCHAYRSSGSGWSYTWPSFFPVLAIDQCIHDASIVPVSYRLQTSVFSDHRIQIFDFSPADPFQ